MVFAKVPDSVGSLVGSNVVILVGSKVSAKAGVGEDVGERKQHLDYGLA